MMKALFSILFTFCLLVGASATELNVSAASSLTDAMKEIAAAYQKQTGTEIRLNFGASSMLARQIEEGAPADVFLSADEPKMDGLEKAGLLAPGTRRTLLSNTLVIVVPSDNQLQIRSAADLATNEQVKRIAISQPAAVPVGIYTKEYLTKLGLWDKISGKVVPTENVRASLAAVESGNAQAGFVYRTDLLISHQVKAALEIPAAEGPKIRYPIAALKASSKLDEAKHFLEFLEGPSGLGVFEKFGFVPVN